MALLVVKKADNAEELEASYRLRYEVYVKKLGWLNNSFAGHLERDEYDRPGRSSTFIAYREDKAVGEGIIGTIRAIYPDGVMLPIYRDFPECRFPEAEHPCEVSRLIASDVFRVLNAEERMRYARHSVSLALIRALYRETHQRGISHWFASLDLSVLRLVRFFGFPFEDMGSPKFYMGSLAAPVCLPRQAWEVAMMANPPLCEYLNSDIWEDVVEDAGSTGQAAGPIPLHELLPCDR